MRPLVYAWFRLAHLATIVIVALQAWLGRLCPLTIWELELRRAAGQAYQEQSFIEYWVARYLYLDLPSTTGSPDSEQTHYRGHVF